MKYFVYGTLKASYRGAAMFDKHQFVAIGATVPIMNLASRGFPVATFSEKFPDKPSGKIIGEIWDVTPEQERQLDAYEGYPSFYTKEKIMVTDEGDQQHQCYIYLGNEAASPDLDFHEPNQAGYMEWSR